MNHRDIMKATERLRAEAKAKTVAVAVCEGTRVVSNHLDFIVANTALCAVLDDHFEKHPEATGHNFVLVPLNRHVEPGSNYAPNADVVFYP
jgi:hypothetical protein